LAQRLLLYGCEVEVTVDPRRDIIDRDSSERR